jgi:hypothetical protein
VYESGQISLLLYALVPFAAERGKVSFQFNVKGGILKKKT